MIRTKAIAREAGVPKPKTAGAYSSFHEFWSLDPNVVFLNHGSFGACPKVVLRRQADLRRRLEKEPLVFLDRQLEGLLDEARNCLAGFLRCPAADLVFVPNATTGVNTVLRSLSFSDQDEILVTSHGYNACNNAAAFVAQRSGAKLVTAILPFPVRSPEEIINAVLDRVTRRTRLLLIDHVTSPTALVLPLKALIAELSRRGIDTLVDGAHAPGMISLNLQDLGAAYYTGNLHKWVCAPKGSAFLYVKPEHQHRIRPLTISHGANSRRTDRSKFLIEFDWSGTDDPTPFLCAPTAVAFLESLLPGGIEALQAENRRLALEARSFLSQQWQIEPPCPESMIGSMASFPLPDAPAKESSPPLSCRDPLQTILFRRYQIEIPIMAFSGWPRRLIRISAQLYNSMEQYHRLAEALKAEQVLAGTP